MQKADALTRKTGDAKEGSELQFFLEGTILPMENVNDTAIQDPDIV